MAKVQLQLFERKRKEHSGVGRVCAGEGGGVEILCTGGAFQRNAGSKPLGDSFDFNLFARL